MFATHLKAAIWPLVIACTTPERNDAISSRAAHTGGSRVWVRCVLHGTSRRQAARHIEGITRKASASGSSHETRWRMKFLGKIHFVSSQSRNLPVASRGSPRRQVFPAIYFSALTCNSYSIRSFLTPAARKPQERSSLDRSGPLYVKQRDPRSVYVPRT
jgi:hypothetical protein